MKTKKDCQIEHAKRAMFKRYGVKLTNNDVNDVIEGIQNNKFKLLDKQSVRTSRFIADVKGIKTIVVYDKNRKSIVTFMFTEPDEELRNIFGYKGLYA